MRAHAAARPPKIGHELCTNLTADCHFLATMLACDVVAGWGARTGEATMRSVLNEVFLFSCVGALFMGIVLTAVTLIG